MEPEEITNIKKLYDAALRGDTDYFQNLFQENQHILDRCIIEKSSAYTQSPLHVAANVGHTGFTEELLKRKPELAEEVDQVKMRSPLHMASAKGHLPIIQTLVDKKPQMCYAYDRDGKTPVHVAVVNGHIEALKVLLQKQPLAVREPTTRGESVLHLCVKYNQPDALRYLVEIRNENDLLYSLDNGGNTVFRLAVAANQTQMVNILETHSRIKMHATSKRRDEDGDSQARPSTKAATRLYETTLEGNIDLFRNLLREDPLILDRCMIENSGRFMQSPLHIAAEMGHLDIVRKMIELNPSMCLAHDQDGRNPIHAAAVKGQTDVVEVLYRANRHAAQEKTYNGETILHLCVKHNQLNTLQILLQLSDGDGEQLLKSRDKNDNTILHLAMTSKQTEMVKYLLGLTKIKKIYNVVNKNKMTAVDIYLKQYKKDTEEAKIILQSLNDMKFTKAKKAKEVLSREAEKNWLANQRSAVMVVASLIATMAFQAGINPPGGVYQDGKDGYTAGTAIWSYYHDDTYRIVLISNTIGLISSLSVILLLISGLPLKRHFLSILRVILWISVTATSYTYLLAINYVTASIDEILQAILKAVQISLYTWIGLVTIISLGNAMRFIKKVMGWKKRQALKEYFKNLWNITRDDNEANNRDLDPIHP